MSNFRLTSAIDLIWWHLEIISDLDLSALTPDSNPSQSTTIRSRGHRPIHCATAPRIKSFNMFQKYFPIFVNFSPNVAPKVAFFGGRKRQNSSMDIPFLVTFRTFVLESTTPPLGYPHRRISHGQYRMAPAPAGRPAGRKYVISHPILISYSMQISPNCRPSLMLGGRAH